MAYIVMAYIVMVDIVMVDIVMAYEVMAYIILADLVMADRGYGLYSYGGSSEPVLEPISRSSVPLTVTVVPFVSIIMNVFTVVKNHDPPPSHAARHVQWQAMLMPPSPPSCGFSSCGVLDMSSCENTSERGWFFLRACSGRADASGVPDGRWRSICAWPRRDGAMGRRWWPPSAHAASPPAVLPDECEKKTYEGGFRRADVQS